VALSQVVVTAALVVGTAVADHALGSATGPGPAVGGVIQGVALLLLASLGLPLTLRVVPVAVDAAVHAGAGRRALAAAGGHVERLATGIASPSKVSAGHRLATAPVRVVAGVARGPGRAATGPADRPAGNDRARTAGETARRLTDGRRSSQARRTESGTDRRDVAGGRRRPGEDQLR
jgi:hypothetical protein